MSQSPLFAGIPQQLSAMPTDQMTRNLADREEIRDLIYTYAHRVTHGLSVANLFTDDGAYIHRRSRDQEPHVTRGREALDAHYIERPDSAGGATPMIHNLLLAVEGDEASGICSIELRIWGADAQIMASGFYEDRLRRENGRWKFVERAVTFFHWNSGESASA